MQPKAFHTRTRKELRIDATDRGPALSRAGDILACRLAARALDIQGCARALSSSVPCLKRTQCMALVLFQRKIIYMGA